MIVGIIPAPGSGLRTMAATGQLARLTRHFRAYRDAGHDLRYFSSLPDDLAWPLADVRRPRQPCGVWRSLLRPLRESLAWYTCDVLRATSLLGAVPAITAKLALCRPFVVSAGADYEVIASLHGRPVWKWRFLRHLASRFADAVIVPNPDHAHALRPLYPRARIVHVPNWVDTEMFRPGSRPEGPPTVLYVGRLVKEKNLERLARACRRIGARLLCVGEGPLKGTLLSLGAECPGAVPWEELPAWHRRAHVFCLPSYTEGSPKALLEAMASGLACAISTEVRGLLTSNEAQLFPPEDEETMAYALDALLTNRTRAAYVATNARLASLRYDMRDVLPREVRLVEEVAG